MLEIKNLTKVYKTKGGVAVRALDDVTLSFPEYGMVFLLGKSGSGKSTLLNVAGGLDAPDSGEIIVKGKSSKKFSAADFDSYRNTYVGFIFQEYNILNEFNVEQNVALALQLQGEKSDKESVDALLKEVDLNGLGKRKPNTLSGGQKQRVAIARALIKQPEILMADEPTGALDSATGKQVLDTLKKLSKTKLVIVVSHDREFAETYGDRIIELADGKVISDETKNYDSASNVTENVSEIGNDTLRIADASKITEKDMEYIFSRIKSNKGELIIASGERDVANVKKACKITDDGQKEYFAETKPEQVNKKVYEKDETKFIKSRLPAGRALKMGASGLKVKPGRLVLTVLLSIIAFTMFGILSTMMMYDPYYTVASALKTSPYEAIVLGKKYEVTNKSYRYNKNTGEKDDYYEYTFDMDTVFGASELTRLNQNDVGLNFAGVFDYGNYRINYGNNFGNVQNEYYGAVTSFLGFSDCGKDYMAKNGFGLLAGDYPAKKDEIAVSSYVYGQFKTFGYMANTSEVISEPQNLIGKTLRISSYESGEKVELKITGVYDIAVPEKYDVLAGDTSGIERRTLQELKTEFEEIISYGFSSVCFVSDEFYDAYVDVLEQPVYEYVQPLYGYGIQFFPFAIDAEDLKNYEISEYSQVGYYTADTVKNNAKKFLIFDNNGNKLDNDTFTVDYDRFYISFNSVMEQASWLYEEYSSLNETEKSEFAEFISAYDRLKNVSKNFKRFSAIASPGNDVKTITETVLAECPELGKQYVYNMYGNGSALSFGGVYMSSAAYDSSNLFIVSESLISDYEVASPYHSDGYSYSWVNETFTDYVVPADARYDHLITLTDNALEQTEFMLTALVDQGTSRYMNNSLYESANGIADMVDSIKTVFLIIGCVLAVFSALMLFNFISVSIAAKRKDIGILRAVGARGVDVFKIFFSEAAIITSICFVGASILSGIGCLALNKALSDTFIKFSIFNFGLINVGIIFAIALFVSFIATIFPVMVAAKKPPVESIRAL